MDTPQKLTVEELKERYRQYAVAQTYLGPGGLLRHKCGRVLRFLPAHCSIHNTAFRETCAGAGRVELVPVPYCPTCEPEPAASGCIHVPGECIAMVCLDVQYHAMLPIESATFKRS